MSSSLAIDKLNLRYQWMFGKTTDLTFFYAPILFGIAMYLLGKSSLAHVSPFWAVVAANAFGAGPFHQGATWFFYFDKENRQHFLSSRIRQLVFFAAPVLILVATVIGAIYAYYATIFFWMLWSLQHLVKQNVGILLLYHRYGQNEAIVPKDLEIKSQQASAIMFTLIFFYAGMLKYQLGIVMLPVIAISIAYTAAFTIQYIASIVKQTKEGAYLNVPAQLFWCTSMLCLSPLVLLGPSFDDGYIIPITVHWFQYIVINYVLVKNKYSQERAASLPTSKPILLFFLFCLSIVVCFLLLGVAKDLFPNIQAWQKSILVGIVLGLGNVHYFLDAFLWRFREPFQRQAVLPYLIAAR